MIQIVILYLERLDLKKNIILLHNLLLYIPYKMMQIIMMETLICSFQQVLVEGQDLCT